MKQFKWIIPLVLVYSSHAGEGVNAVYGYAEHLGSIYRSYDFSASGNALQYPTMTVSTGAVKYAELLLQAESSFGNGTCYYIQTSDWAWANVDTRIWAPDQNGNYVSLDDDGGRYESTPSANYYSSQAVIWIRAGSNYKAKVRVAVYSPSFNTASFRLFIKGANQSDEAGCLSIRNYNNNTSGVPMAAATYTENGVHFYNNN